MTVYSKKGVPMATGVKIRLRDRLQEKAKQEGRALISQEEVVLATGISRPTVSNWMKSRVDRVDLDVLVRFCNYLECDIADLMTLER